MTGSYTNKPVNLAWSCYLKWVARYEFFETLEEYCGKCSIVTNDCY